MQTCMKQQISPEEYVAGERSSGIKHEYVDGEVFAMAGASREHNQIAANIVRILGNQLTDRPCSVFVSDMKVKIEAARLYTYPDVLVVCGKEEYADRSKDILLNPVLIIEIISDSTEAYDRGDKFFHYQKLVSLVEYVLVSQSCCKVECFSRQKDGKWMYAIFQDMASELFFDSIDCTLPMIEVYRKVNVTELKDDRYI